MIELKEGQVYKGNLDLSYRNTPRLPNNLKVRGHLDLSHTDITYLPDNLMVEGDLYLINTKITKLPNNLTIDGHLYLRHTNITELPDNLKVGGSLHLSHTAIKKLPDSLTVHGFLDFDTNHPLVSSKSNCGINKRTIYVFKFKDKIICNAGCFRGSFKEFCERVRNEYESEAGDRYIEDMQECIDGLN